MRRDPHFEHTCLLLHLAPNLQLPCSKTCTRSRPHPATSARRRTRRSRPASRLRTRSLRWTPRSAPRTHSASRTRSHRRHRTATAVVAARRRRATARRLRTHRTPSIEVARASTGAIPSGRRRRHERWMARVGRCMFYRNRPDTWVLRRCFVRWNFLDHEGALKNTVVKGCKRKRNSDTCFIW